MRSAWLWAIAIGCGGTPAVAPPVVAPPAPAKAPAPAPISRCGDLSIDSIAGIRLGLGEAAVRAAVGAPTSTTTPSSHFEPNAAQQRWFSSSTWAAHDLAVTWVSLGDPARPRTVFSVALGSHGDLTTSCGVRIGTPRADAERAYQDAIATWQHVFAGAAEGGFLGGPAETDDVALAAAGGTVIGVLDLDHDRVVGIALTDPSVMFANQW